MLNLKIIGEEDNMAYKNIRKINRMTKELTEKK